MNMKANEIIEKMKKEDRLLKESAVMKSVQKAIVEMGYEPFGEKQELIYKAIESTKEHNGWIPCSERLPQENEPVDAVCEVVNVMLKSGTVTSGWCNRYLERWYVLDEHCDYLLQQNYEDVIA